MPKHQNKGHKTHYGKKEKTGAPSSMAQQPAPITVGSAPPPPVSVVSPQTLQQQRAGYALKKVRKAIEDGIDQKEFKSYASAFPAMIQMNGLGQAAAFYFSQGETHRKLYEILSGWLIKTGQPYTGKANLLAGITQEDMHRYRIAQAEALLLLDWVKRFAKAYAGD
ncbi:MAG: type III-B CRISPR module-associated protein Cmr5 [Gammaproteobacteria bacterium]|nr:type III-B CRISPR module-associated protein Cmr5 [Gammaproteobacteria bacterium]MBU1655933.1 type III-B CRISPR module-associated protein Cmr5 [Gammaproteobacteria bacterium]MBU1961805.1 type III-B CRISPR module-associated protein Cmr5 [Gammaproteobacteria bacterium]